MNRREFLRTAGGAAGATAAAGSAGSPAAASGGPAALQQGNETDPGNQTGAQNGTAGGNQTEAETGGGGTETVVVGPDGSYVFDPDSVEVAPGTTVVWEWDSDFHNVNPTSIPEGASWEGHQPTEDAGFTYEYTFDVLGTYEYECTPHADQGMVGDVVVTENPSTGGGGGVEEVDPAHMGVPVQKHFVGAGAFLGIFVSLVFIFYLLKYGESAHTSAPSKRD